MKLPAITQSRCWGRFFVMDTAGILRSLDLRSEALIVRSLDIGDVDLTYIRNLVGEYLAESILQAAAIQYQ